VKRPVYNMPPNPVAGGKDKIIIQEGIHGMLTYTIYRFPAAFIAV
jgi:hypothetical protein